MNALQSKQKKKKNKRFFYRLVQRKQRGQNTYIFQARTRMSQMVWKTFPRQEKRENNGAI